MRRKEMFYAVIGGVVGAILVMAAGSFSPLGAQNEVRDAEFETITCRTIRVVNSEGNERIRLVASERGGHVDVHGEDQSILDTSAVKMYADEDGGYVGVYGPGGERGASMGITEHGGTVGVFNKYYTGGTVMETDENGGGGTSACLTKMAKPVPLWTRTNTGTARYLRGTRTGFA